MRRNRWLLAAVVLSVAALAWAAEQMSIQVREAGLRSRPSYLGALTARLDYGDQVTVRSVRGSWYEVTDQAGHTGWLHESALTVKKIVMRSGDQDVAVGASSDDLALAGKGFNAEVEGVFEQEQQLDFTWVDRMESWVVTPEQAAAFLAAGRVRPLEGGV